MVFPIAVGLALRVRLLREAVALTVDRAEDMVIVVAEATIAAVLATSSVDELDVLVLDTFEDPHLMTLRIAEARRARGRSAHLSFGSG